MTASAPISAPPDVPSQVLPRARWSVPIIFVALIAMSLVLVATRTGPGLSPDSRAYLMGARYLLQGHGFAILSGNGEIEPMTHYGPLPCILLAMVSSVGIDAIDAARYLHSTLFAGSILLAAAITWWATQSGLAALLAAMLIGFSYDLLRTHAMVWSEPSFIFFMLLGVLLLGPYLRQPTIRKLVAAALVVGTAFLARYSGVALVLSCTAAVFFNGSQAWRRRLRDSVIFVLVASLPMILWVMRNFASTGNAANREISFHPPRRRDIDLSIQTVVQWIVPPSPTEQVIAIVTSAILLGPVIGCYWWFRVIRPPSSDGSRTARNGPPGRKTLAILLWFAPIYLGFLLFSITFVDALTPLDYRILSPLQASLGILLSVFGTCAIARSHKALGAFAACVLIAVLCSNAVRATRAPFTGAIDLGYSEAKWTQSPALRWVRSLPPDTVLYSNAQEAMYFGAERFARPIPKVVKPLTRRPANDYPDHLAGLAHNLRENGGYIVYFRHIRRPYLVTEARIVEDLTLELVKEFPDAAVYQLPRNSSGM
jgi:hypothetical protein